MVEQMNAKWERIRKEAVAAKSRFYPEIYLNCP
jgi:hypothetical protein